MAREYHVSKWGDDFNNGTREHPFLTISKAAEIAVEGDTVIVHEGTYREWVKPANGARTDANRITYTAAEGEKVIIKGSEIVEGFEKNADGTWSVNVDNSIFGKENPFAIEINGDWLVRPLDHPCHTGMVYIDGKALREKNSHKAPSEGEMFWWAEVKRDVTVINVNFADIDPREHTIEINVRKCCFYPEKTGLNYITVRGFEMCQCATAWAPPTAEQFGIIGPHWAKGWIIENNNIHDARCSAITIGKEVSTGDNMHSRYHRKAGYQTQLEVVFAAKRIGWEREIIGSHIIRNNVLHHCGQNGVVGHLGSAFSEIYGNEIYEIGTMHEYFGWEIAGIKLHAAIDTYVHDNYIHHCILGSWFDWQAQGLRLSRNLYYKNTKDIFVEVTHGPYIIDNNIFGGKQNFINAAQGGAIIHNIFLGGIQRYDVLDRSTPYHFSHTTDIKGTAVVYGGDDRYYNNLFADTMQGLESPFICGTGIYNAYPSSMEEYIERVCANGRGNSDYMQERQAVYIANNYYSDNVAHYENEIGACFTDTSSDARMVEESDGIYLEITLDDKFDTMTPSTVKTSMLGMPRITEELYENADGTPIVFDKDFFGNSRGGTPTVGAIEGLKSGKQKILVRKNKI